MGMGFKMVAEPSTVTYMKPETFSEVEMDSTIVSLIMVIGILVLSGMIT